MEWKHGDEDDENDDWINTVDEWHASSLVYIVLKCKNALNLEQDFKICSKLS